MGERGCRRLEMQRDDGIWWGLQLLCVTNTGRPSSGLVGVHGVVGFISATGSDLHKSIWRLTSRSDWQRCAVNH